MPNYSIHANNQRLDLAAPESDTTVSAKRVLRESRWHPASYCVHADAHADAANPPADFDERAGEELELVDLAATEQVIIRHRSRDFRHRTRD